MTSKAFEAVLSEPNEVAACSRLYALITTRDFSSASLPTVAEKYLYAFCDSASSTIRRRWIGLALAAMMGASDAVSQRLSKLNPQIQGVGAAIISDTEREETKVVAGLILRQALDRGLEYNSFWSSNKVKDSAPNFPREADCNWMKKFQVFLDTLGDLALANPTTDPSIIFPVSVVTSDGLSWPQSNDGTILALIQAGMLTVIVTDGQLRHLSFVDTPLNSIRHMQSGPSTHIESQVRSTEHEPWDLVLTLKVNSWTYSVDTTRRKGTRITFIFQHSKDAIEWKNCIREHQKELKEGQQHPEELFRISSEESPQAGNDDRLQPPQCHQTPSMLVGEPRSSTHVRRRTRPAEKEADSSSLQEHHSSDSNDPLIDGSVMPTQDDSRSSAQRTANSKGKLSKVSQSAKKRAFKQLRSETNDADYSPEQSKDAGTSRSAKQTAAAGPKSLKRTQRSRVTKTKASNGTNGKKAQHKRKTNDDDDNADDDYVPGTKPLRKRNHAKRKLLPDDVVSDGRARKKARTERPGMTPDGAQPTVDQHAVNKIGKCDVSKPETGSQSQRTGQATLYSNKTSRHSVIKGLKHSQKSPEALAPSFKKPGAPARAVQTPSTPTRSTYGMSISRTRPRTPVHVHKQSPGPFFASTPPPEYRTVGQSGSRRRTVLDTEILSSNSKPTPASPNADSTAISGHADCKDMILEKREGDMQTAKSDPFQQRRDGQKLTSFVRRLTEEDQPNVQHNHDAGASHAVLFEFTNLSSPGMGHVAGAALLSRPMPSHKKATKPTAEGISVRTPLTPARRTLESVAPGDSRANKATRDHGSSCHSHSATACKPRSTSGELAARAPPRGSDDDSPMKHAAHREAREHDTHAKASIPNASMSINGQTQGADPPRENYDGDEEGDATLINSDEAALISNKLQASPLHFRSSPPSGSSSSSHSSTSAASGPQTPSEIEPPTSDAEELEWESSLQPHQRALHDLLLRTSKRVLRHVVDNETAVTDIAEVFSRDGEHIVNALQQQHDGAYEHVFQNMESKKKGLKKDLERTAKRLTMESKRIGSMI
jgi:hypothetical protein